MGLTRRSGLNLLLCVLLVGCTSGDNRASIEEKDLAGAWVLETVGGSPPSTVNIKSWRINFSANQKWTYSGEMTGPFGGAQVSGSGTWTISAVVLEYTAGNNKGQSIVTIQNGTLTLSPDPVIMPDGKTPTVTKYRRANE